MAQQRHREGAHEKGDKVEGKQFMTSNGLLFFLFLVVAGQGLKFLFLVVFILLSLSWANHGGVGC